MKLFSKLSNMRQNISLCSIVPYTLFTISILLSIAAESHCQWTLVRYDKRGTFFWIDKLFILLWTFKNWTYSFLFINYYVDTNEIDFCQRYALINLRKWRPWTTRWSKRAASCDVRLPAIRWQVIFLWSIEVA